MPALSRFSRARSRRQPWWLLAVLCLSLLAPGISAALSHARGDFSALQDVCRSPAAQRSGEQPPPIEAALDLLAKGHCPACHAGTPDMAGPPPAVAVPLLTGLRAQAPERFWTAPVTAHAWRRASARGPPHRA